MKRVLIVEDDRFLAKAYQVAFSRIQLETEMAFNGVEALQKVNSWKPDLILLDILLPLKDGFEVLKELKADKRTKGIPVLIASNLGQPKEITKGKELGAIGYIIKSDTSISDVISLICQTLSIDQSEK
jgi:DNA-binding response OmpR family regulator